jgi:hypothetical protein
MENREELGLSPWRSATTSNEYWDRGLEDNPQFPISVGPAIDEIVGGSRLVFTSSVSNRPSSFTGPNNSSQLRRTRPQATNTHTFSRHIDNTIPSSSMAPSGIRSDEFYRSSTGRYGQGTCLDSSISEDIKVLTNYVNQFQAITKAQYLELGNRLSLLETIYNSPIINAEASEGVDNMEDTFSLAPRSREGNLLSHDEICSPVSSRRPQPSCALGGPPPSLDGGSTIQGEVENPSAVGYREALRHIVYTIRRELSEVPMSSSPRKVLAPSNCISCSDLLKDKPKGYKSFPESGHTKSAFDFMNESISNFHSSKGTGNKYNGLGPATFPSSKIRSMDFAIHDSSLGKGYPSCDKTYSALLGTKPVEGLVLNQSTWTKSESNLRLMSSVLSTAEHCMAAAGSLLKEKGDEFDELKSFLLQVDQSLGVSQVLLMGTLSNFTLSKRQEMLDKSPIPELLKETLLFSSLVKDKLVGLPLGKLQEVSKTPDCEGRCPSF